MAEAQAGGLLDLEKELTCSICTDILYQPLTLLDCLHTFCGSCLKDWFSFQASKATSPHPYTCPSCRASVRDTKRNAQVTTLLDIFLQANPGRIKSEAEKEELGNKYTHGENVLPEVHIDSDSEDDELMEEVRQRSLQEVGVSQGRLRVPQDRPRDGSRQSSRERSRDGRDSRHSTNGHGHHSHRSGAADSRSHGSHRSASHRNIEHQASLRSLISSSDVGSDEEEEMMRQILQEIDLSGLDPSREDEINRAVSVAYRRHRHHGSRSRPAERTRSPSRSPGPVREERSAQQRRQHARSESAIATPQHPRLSRPPDSRPPVSRPHLFQAAEDERSGGHRRSSSQDVHPSRRNRASSEQDRELLTNTSSRPAARSATDLSDQPQSTSRPRRMSFSDRSTTDPERTRTRDALPAANSSSNVQVAQSVPPIRSTFGSRGSPRQSPARRGIQNGQPPSTAPGAISQSPTSQSPPVPSSPRFPPPNASHGRPNSASNPAPHSRHTLYVEPSISCYRCNRPHIEYELHYHCPKCENGSVNICLTCYRSPESRGCNHWYGFGHVARAKYQSQLSQAGPQSNIEPPHTLIGHRYRRPRQAIAQPASASTGPRTMTDEDPARRLQAGVFCDICSAFANSCYWSCDICNDGAWGFCHTCVNQGRHCTHPLLPIAKDAPSQDPPTSPTASSIPAKTSPLLNTTPQPPPPLPPPSSSTNPPNPSAPPPLPSVPAHFHPLTVTTTCDLCRYPIPPSHSRYHCPACHAGDYDICFACYHGLVAAGHLAPHDGDKGWRRCPRWGHRMQVVGFEDREGSGGGGGGRRRRVLRERVGGWALPDEDVPALGATSSGAAGQAGAGASGGGVLGGGAAGAGSGSGSGAGAVEEADPAEDDAVAGASVSWRRGRPAWSWRDADGTVRHSNGPRSPPLAVFEAGSSSSSSLQQQQQQQKQQMARIPPDGGVGMRLRARWAWFPAEGVTNELMFPRCAEIREAMDINGDWCWGVYAGRGGLFPGGYVVRA